MRHIALTGYMGSGKTSLGKKIAKELDYPFVDLDAYIEEQHGQSIQDIFGEKGEVFFRELETKYLSQILAFTENPVLLSLGGGVMESHVNAELLLSNSFLVYLKFSPKILRSRLENSKSKRPIIANLKGGELERFIEQHLSVREKNYCKAHYVLDNVMDINERIQLISNAYFK